MTGNLLLELKCAWRSLAVSWKEIGACIMSLAFGSAFALSLVSVSYPLVWGTLPFSHSNELFALETKVGNKGFTTRMNEGDFNDLLRESTKTISGLAYYTTAEYPVESGANTFFARVAEVNKTFLDVLGVSITSGRRPMPQDGDSAALVSESFAVKHFGSVQRAVGRSISLRGEVVFITGTISDRDSYPLRTTIWCFRQSALADLDRTAFNLQGVIVRTKPGEGLVHASAEISQVNRSIQRAFPATNRDRYFVLVPFREHLGGDLSTSVMLLSLIATMLLCIAALNTAQIISAHAVRSTPELKIRLSLGASPTRVVFPLILEIVVVTTVGVTLGTISSAGLLHLMPHISNSSLFQVPGWELIEIQCMTLATIFILWLLTGACAVLMALYVRKEILLGAIGSARHMSQRDATRQFGTIFAEAAVCVILIAIASDLGVGLRKVLFTSPGYSTSDVLVSNVSSITSSRSASIIASQHIASLIESLRGYPGVDKVASIRGLPNAYFVPSGSYGVAGGTGMSSPDAPQANFLLVSPDYFSTMSIKFFMGRDFTSNDVVGGLPVVIISKSLAQQSFGSVTPLGKRLTTGYDSSDIWMTVVGVIDDVRQESGSTETSPSLYMPTGQHPARGDAQQIVLKLKGKAIVDPGPLSEEISRALPGFAVETSRMSDIVSSEQIDQKFESVIVLAILLSGLGLGLIGTYGVTTYVCSQRTFEIALRLAFGSSYAQVVGRLMAGILVPCVIGATCACCMLPLALRLAEHFIAVPPAPWKVIVYSSIMSIATTCVASIAPLRRIRTVSPVILINSHNR